MSSIVTPQILKGTISAQKTLTGTIDSEGSLKGKLNQAIGCNVDLSKDTVQPRYLVDGFTAHNRYEEPIVGTLNPDNVVLTSPIEDSHGNTITDHDDEFIWGNTKYTKV